MQLRLFLCRPAALDRWRASHLDSDFRSCGRILGLSQGIRFGLPLLFHRPLQRIKEQLIPGSQPGTSDRGCSSSSPGPRTAETLTAPHGVRSGSVVRVASQFVSDSSIPQPIREDLTSSIALHYDQHVKAIEL
ncbi:hypothetical protein TREES_T100011908 [Tupaia chinensis]|uniref:Uncharacterized protein n=1 Tax=Tupaia chinensis TaxID=246437 RepID=L9KSR9_TUPCH|nr:hypothetical protein TREES_T100011908 [Tupaia chinensis]